jgi:hypothetical protein
MERSVTAHLYSFVFISYLYKIINYVFNGMGVVSDVVVPIKPELVWKFCPHYK